jgi:pimeloyl-ACP methyl ester carboxylesterase
MNRITTKDSTEIYYKDWGTGPPAIFSHGWPLSADSWEAQMLFLANGGYRCIAHDRRGHGRSSQPWNGNDMDNFADDLSELSIPSICKAQSWSPFPWAAVRLPAISVATVRKGCPRLC